MVQPPTTARKMISPETRILSIDFGFKRIGLALSDPLKTFAYPYKTLINDTDFLSKLTNLINEKKIIRVILGLPDADNKSTQKLKNEVLLLKQQIEKLEIEVVLWDEMYTSSIASEKILQSISKKSKRRNKELIDQHAAAIILQEYLDSKVNADNK